MHTSLFNSYKLKQSDINLMCLSFKPKNAVLFDNVVLILISSSFVNSLKDKQ